MPIYVYKNNQQMGPYEPKQVLDMLRDATLLPEDLGIEQGGTAWQKLGDIFPGVGVQRPSSEAAASVASEPSKSKGGCLKDVLLGLGILMLIAGIATAIGSRFIPSVSCDLAESDSRKIDKLRSDLEKANSENRFDRTGALQIELNGAIAGAETSRKYCNDDKFRNNMVAAGGGAVAFVGLLMSVIGLFVGRKK